MADSDIEDIKSFVSDNETKKRILERIIEYEENNPPSSTFEDKDCVDISTWEPGRDVSMGPAYIGMFKNAPFIDIVFDTQSSTVLCLSDLDNAKKALSELDDKPEEWSDEWIEDMIGGSKIDEALSDIPVSEEEAEEIHSITEDVDALDYWYKYIAPGLKHRDKAKKVVLILLASPRDAYGNKGRVNLLAYGPPGTGKTAIKNYLTENFGAESIDGPRVSKADITYNKSSGKFGQLAKAHRGILVVEESDEMDEEPLGAALTSLGESGEIEIRDKQIPAEARGVFLSNFRSIEEAISQWSEEAVNRFDFKINFDRLSDEHKSEAIDWHYNYFRQPKPEDNQTLLLKYIKLCRTFDPEVSEIEEIQQFKDENISKLDNVREGISVMNIAWIIARLNFSDVKLEHYKQAYELVTQR